MNRGTLIGQTFGRLTVLERAPNLSKNSRWLCQCQCGKQVIVHRSSLIKGETLSCGCWKREKAVLDNTTHGKKHTRLYGVWSAMKSRCYNSHNKRYKDYGGRGICVCEDWRTDFEAFYIWAINNGYDSMAPYGKCTIDRINVNGNYEPNNCRWVDLHTQANNKRKGEEDVI